MNQEQRIAYVNDLRRKDEVDIMELFAILWQGKSLLIAFVAIVAIAAFVILKSVPSEYRIEAVLDSTSEYNVQALQPSILEKGAAYQVTPLEVKTVYMTGLAHAGSLYVKKSFWEARTGQPLTTRTSGADLTENDREFQEFVKTIEVTPPDPKNENATLSTIAFQTERPEQGVKLLEDYIAFVDRFTINQFVTQLETGYASNLARLIEDYESRYRREEVAIEDELVRLEEAHSQAQALGIVDTPYEQVQNVELSLLDSRLYLLGASVLGEEMKMLKARQQMPLEAFVPQLRNMEHWRGQLESDLKKLKAADKNVRAFVMVSPPESSLEPVAPNKLLIFIASVLGAGVLGVIFVFARHGIRSFQARYAGPQEVATSDNHETETQAATGV